MIVVVLNSVIIVQHLIFAFLSFSAWQSILLPLIQISVASILFYKRLRGRNEGSGLEQGVGSEQGIGYFAGFLRNNCQGRFTFPFPHRVGGTDKIAAVLH